MAKEDMAGVEVTEVDTEDGNNWKWKTCCGDLSRESRKKIKCVLICPGGSVPRLVMTGKAKCITASDHEMPSIRHCSQLHTRCYDQSCAGSWVPIEPYYTV